MKFRPAIPFVLAWLMLGGLASSQTLSFSPGGGGTVAAAAPGMPSGRDFATEVMGDPWDFEQESDWNQMFSVDPVTPSTGSWVGRPALIGGVMTGVVNSQYPNVSMHFEGIAGGFNMAGRNGVRYPIDASRFKRISFRVRRSVNAPAASDLMGVIWFTGITRSAAANGGRLFPSRGYDPHAARHENQMPAAQQGTGWQIYKVDLDGSSPLAYGQAWANTVRGFEIRLGTGNELKGSTIDIDWVRLTERGTAMATLNFTGFGGPVTVTARHAETGDTIQIYPDNGTSATTFADNSTHQWDYGFLPPGTWTITSTGRNGTQTRELSVDPAPIVHVTEPDVSGGRDFATTVLGDAWDLTSASDVSRGRLYDMTGATFGAERAHRDHAWSRRRRRRPGRLVRRAARRLAHVSERGLDQRGRLLPPLVHPRIPHRQGTARPDRAATTTGAPSIASSGTTGTTAPAARTRRRCQSSCSTAGRRPSRWTCDR